MPPINISQNYYTIGVSAGCCFCKVLGSIWYLREALYGVRSVKIASVLTFGAASSALSDDTRK